MKTYSQIPEKITYNDIVNKHFTLSSSQYKLVMIPNKNYVLLKELMRRPLKRIDLGQEVGSLSYIGKSTCYFIRTKALQEDYLLPVLNKETAVPILPSEFIQMGLKGGDILISKDSNIGEIAILDKDYPNYMLSGAIYKLPIKEEWKYYVLSFVKNSVFREQLDSMVPKGATIRHAKTMFLDCKIPLPVNNSQNTIEYISLLTKALINKEMAIKQRHSLILSTISSELENNQQHVDFKYKMPNNSDIQKIGRLDTGLYCKEYKELEFIIKNYRNGCFKLYEKGYRVLRGPNLAVSVIGPTHYSDSIISDKYYKLIQGVDLSEYGTVVTERFFGNKNSIQRLKEGDILFSAEGSIGKVFITIDLSDKAVTNYHGMTITNDDACLFEKCYIGCMFFWYRNKGWFDYYSVGGQGGSFGKEKTENLLIPNFPKDKQEELSSLYHKGRVYDTSMFTLANFTEKDEEYNKQAGIYELDKSAKYLKRKLNKAIDDVINGREVIICF